MKQTEIGLIPEDWNVIKLGDYSKLKNGFAFKSEYFSDKGPIVVTPGNFKLEGGLKFESNKTIRYKGPVDDFMKFSNGDLIMVMTDLTPDCNLLGKSGIVNTDEVLLHNQRIGKLILKKDLNSLYLSYFLNSSMFSNRMKNTATGSTVRHTSSPTIKNTYLSLPPLAEQEAIATALSNCDSWIDSIEEVLAKKRLIKQGAIQELLTPREDWEVKKLGEIINFKNGAAHENVVDENGDYVIVNSKFISQEGRVRKYSNAFLCPLYKNEIVMVMSDIPNGKALAKCFIIDHNNTYTLNQRICAFEAKDNFNPKFLFYKINRNDYFLSFDSGSGQTNLRRDEVLNCPIDFPSLSEQMRIATILSDMDVEIEVLEEKLHKARQIKQGMMQELLTGRVRLV
ncbi:restriction endonuclease subunit S [Kaistella flava (ex Peng et al. 2021)]|nr:restriction endonuclease subunit S [Kaistella flava (ex Peng et al. 2021)]